MKIKSLIIVLLASLTFNAVQAQDSLTEAVAEAGVSWVIGQWEGRTDDGAPVNLSFQWDLNQHAIMGHVKTSDWEGKSVTVADATEDEVTYYGIDNRGSVARGLWAGEDGKAILKYRYRTRNGESGRTGIAYSKTDDDKMTIEIFDLDGNDDFIRPAKWELTLKRK